MTEPRSPAPFLRAWIGHITLSQPLIGLFTHTAQTEKVKRLRKASEALIFSSALGKAQGRVRVRCPKKRSARARLERADPGDSCHRSKTKEREEYNKKKFIVY